MIDRIMKDDIVDVIFERAQCLFGVKVLYTPSQPGDAFVLKGSEGTIYDVMNYCYIKKIKDGNTDEP